jgi:hypothetical protein
MWKSIIIVAVLVVFAYVKRHGFRRAAYVLWTGIEHPDWDKLGSDYYLASWEKTDWAKRQRKTPEGGEVAN